jgi:hypothetical protein
VLAGTGDGAAWLARHAAVGATVELAQELRAGGAPLEAGAALDVVNGGPRLVRAGRLDVTAVAEGFAWPEDPGFLYRFGLRRNPRTVAGVTGAGTLLLVTVDGRRPGVSVGATFEESARVLRALGARDGVNLDGGGSTTLTVGSDVVNLPSDPTGERPIGDAIVLAP